MFTVKPHLIIAGTIFELRQHLMLFYHLENKKNPFINNLFGMI
jgi:hypothetical protein